MAIPNSSLLVASSDRCHRLAVRVDGRHDHHLALPQPTRPSVNSLRVFHQPQISTERRNVSEVIQFPNAKPPTDDPVPDLPLVLSPAQLSELLTVSVKTITRWREDKVGPPAFKLPGGRFYRYRRDEVIAWIDDLAKKKPGAATPGQNTNL
nr:helix-turn-helix domain-containing protein [Leucobacter aridicollis]